MADEKAPSQAVLEEAPQRALKFLSAVSGNAGIHAALSTRGYGDSDHDEGWEFLLDAGGFRRPKIPVAGTPASREAAVEIDNWDEPNFKIIYAALKRRHPPQFLFVSEDLKPATGQDSIVSVKTMLDRLDELENGSSRTKTRKADHAALATLVERGITKEERERMRALLAIVVKAPDPLPALPVDAVKTTEKRVEALTKLRSWYEEWSEVARAVIKRRDWLILLGLAKRKRSKKEDSTPPATATPPA